MTTHELMDYCKALAAKIGTFEIPGYGEITCNARGRVVESGKGTVSTALTPKGQVVMVSSPGYKVWECDDGKRYRR